MPDNIPFMTIPLDWRVPGQYIEIEHTRAVRGLPGQPRRILILGQRLSTGSVAQGVLTRVSRSDDGVNYFGRGSMLSQMIAASIRVNPTTETWALALDDLVAGVKATGTITVAGTALAAGTLYVYVGGARIAVGIAAGDVQNTIATNIAAALNANLDLAVTAAAATNVVTLTARHKGAEGNDINIRFSYFDGEFVPSGVTLTIAAMSGGSGNPDVLTAIAAMSTGAYYTIVMPWSDGANMTAMENELNSRWGGLDMRTGHCFSFKNGTFGALGTYGSVRNSAHSSVPGLNKSPTLPWVIAAQFAAAADFSVSTSDPAVPFRGSPLPDIMAPSEADRFTNEERNFLLHDGISTITFDESGAAFIEQIVTTYQTNSFGLEDISLLKLNTKWTVDYIRYAIRFAVARDYPRHKLAGDDILPFIQAGQPIATPKLIRNTIIGEAMKLARAGLLEDIEQFQRDLIVVRSDSDPNRVNAIIPPNIVNQFDVFAAAVQFIL